MTLEIENALESYEALSALIERRNKLEENEDQTAVEAVDGLIEQFQGYPAYTVLVEEKDE